MPIARIEACRSRAFGALGIEAGDARRAMGCAEHPWNWGIRGQPASEIDLGFNLDV